MRTLLTTAVALLALIALALPASADDNARIHLLHGIPDVTVDVEAGGENAIEDFSFGETQDLSSLSGATLADLKVKVAGTDDVAIDAGDVTLPSEGNFTIVAHLDAEGTPTIGVFENDESTIDAGSGRLVVRHTAAAPAVDVLADGAVAFGDLPNGDEASADLPVATYSAEVVPAGEEGPVVIGPAPLGITDGTSLIVYAVGSLDGDSLTVLTETIDGLGSAPARVETGNSPVTDDGELGYSVLLVAAAAAVALTGSVMARRRATVTV